MCRIDRCFNFLFKFTATLSKLRSKSKRGSFGTYEFGGSISRRIFSIISHWNRCQICCGCQQSKLWIWGKYFSLISIIFVEDETSDQPKIHLWSFLWTFAWKPSALGQLCGFLNIYSTFQTFGLSQLLDKTSTSSLSIPRLTLILSRLSVLKVAELSMKGVCWNVARSQRQSTGE